MRNAPAIVRHRLVTTSILLVVGLTFACRPSWSPDSKQLLYPSMHEGRLVIARYDLANGEAHIAHDSQQSKRVSTAHWLADGSGYLEFTVSREQEQMLTAELHENGETEPRVFELPTQENAVNHLLLPPVVLDKSLFVGGKTMTRLDLRTGEQQTSKDAQPLHDLVLCRRGDGICYVGQHDKEDATTWEMGTVDPESLARTPLLRAPDGGWRMMPMPTFTKDLRRFAIPAERGQDDKAETAILVFHDDKLENVLSLDTTGKTSTGSLAWSRDDVTLFATIARVQEDGTHLFSMYEATFSGSVTREVELFEIAPKKRGMRPMTFAMQLALSPDGRHVAMTTAFLEELPAQQHGLLLIEVRGGTRKVVRVPFPTK